MPKKFMRCGMCNKKVNPLDAHMGQVDGKLDVYHIDCWNTYLHIKKLERAEKRDLSSYQFA